MTVIVITIIIIEAIIRSGWIESLLLRMLICVGGGGGVIEEKCLVPVWWETFSVTGIELNLASHPHRLCIHPKAPIQPVSVREVLLGLLLTEKTSLPLVPT